MACRLMEKVYGKWRGESDFTPKPLPASEAGEGPFGSQRRYLWTDAFGVLNLVTEVRRCDEAGDRGGRDDALRATRALVEAVHDTLAQPRSPDLPMAFSERRPFGPVALHRGRRHKGLRIGKRLAAPSSDPGMSLDGMYFHYLDKWLFALARASAEFARHDPDDPFAAELASEAARVVKDVHPHFVERDGSAPLGVRWKINADCSPIRGSTPTRPSGDAVSGCVAYVAVAEALARRDVGPSIAWEQSDMRDIARQLRPAVSWDPLGWGLQAWEAQWLPRDSPTWGRFVDELFSAAATDRVADAGRRRELPFRLYGAYLGARVSERADLQAAATASARDAAERELARANGEAAATADDDDRLDSINRVMLAAALDPLAFCRRVEEPRIV